MSTVYEVGEQVLYHGSKGSAHGEYTVVVKPMYPGERGYVLTRPRDDGSGEDDTLTWVHPQSITRVEEKVVRDRRELNSLGYDDEYLDGIGEFVPDFLEAINDGVFDDHIKTIVAACLDRRDARLGREPMRAALMGRANTATVYDGPVLGEDGYTLSPVLSSYKALEVNGKRYNKSDMEGKHLRLRKSPAGLPWYLHDVLVKIFSVGHQFIVVECVEDPLKRYPGSTELQKKSAGVGYKMKIDPNNVLHIFG